MLFKKVKNSQDFQEWHSACVCPQCGMDCCDVDSDSLDGCPRCGYGAEEVEDELDELENPSIYPLRGLEFAAQEFSYLMTMIPEAWIVQNHEEFLDRANDDDRYTVNNWDFSSAFAVMVDREKACQVMRCDAGIHDWEYFDDGDCESGPMPGRGCKCCGQLE